MTTNRGDAGLRNAPRFHALFTHLEGRQVLLMPRNDWAQLSNFMRAKLLKSISGRLLLLALQLPLGGYRKGRPK
jgi:hypothetical protein